MADIQWNAGGGVSAGEWDNIFARRRERMARKAVAPDIGPALRGDTEALDRVAAQSPDVALKIAGMISQMSVRDAVLAKSRIDYTARVAMGILGAPEADRPGLYAAALQDAQAQGLDTSRYPQTWSPATAAWLNHQARMAGSVATYLKRQGAPAGGGGGGGAPAGGGWSGPPVAPAGGAPAAPVRTSAAPAPAGPAVATSPPAAPPVQLAGNPPMPGAGPMPMAAPPGPPQIAPGAPPDDGVATQRFNPGAPAMLGRDPAYVGGAAAERAFRLNPGETIKIEPKTGKPIEQAGGVWIQQADGTPTWRELKTGKTFLAQDAGDRIELVDQSSGQTIRVIEKAAPPKAVDRIEPLGAPVQAPVDPKAAVRGLQLPPGFRVAGVNGAPVVKDGTVMVVAPDGSYDFVPLPVRNPASGGMMPVLGPDGVTTYVPAKQRPLPQTSIDKLGDAGTTAQEFTGLANTFDDAFAGRPFWGNIDNWIKRNVPDDFGGADPKGQADWWQRYQTQKNLIRNRLFGSALTATEKVEFDKANIDPGMKADKIRTNIKRQADAAMRAAAKMAAALEKSGYNRAAIEAAIGIPLDALPSPTAKPLADTDKPPAAPPAAPGGAVTKSGPPPEKPREIPPGRVDDLRKRYGLD